MTKLLQASALHHTADFVRGYYHAEVDNDVTLADIIRPAFWAHHTAKLRKHSIVDLIRADGSLDVQVRVTEVGVGYAKVRVLRQWEDEDVVAERQALEAAVAQDDGGAIQLPEEYKITSGRGAFSVVFIPTDTKIATGLKTRGLAVKAAREHAEKVGVAWPVPPAPPANPEPVQ